ncbi:MAG TPA: hypothetical protein VFF40_08265 [Acidimicrobiia bacterium]|nr:hypothetical protein [Acidimicrobiia bacterium]
MTNRAFEHALSYRADQAGLLLAGADLPLTFQRTLMPRPTLDQAIVTGLAVYANHAVVSLVQESIQSFGIVAPRLAGRRRSTADERRLEPDDHRARRGRDRRRVRDPALLSPARS